MREKEIDRRTGGVWYEFGVHKDGCVDVACIDGDVFTHIPVELANWIVFERQLFLNKLYDILKDYK